MLELFRKYSLVAFVVLILLFFGLIFMVDGIGQTGLGSGPKRMTFEGRTYTQSEVEKLGNDYNRMFYTMTMETQGFSNPSIVTYLTVMRGEDERDYLAKRLLLKNLSKSIGIAASEDQIESYIKKSVFVNEEKNFDHEAYTEFIEKRVKRSGLGTQDFNTLIGEVLIVSKLKEIIGSGNALDPQLLEQAIKARSQVVTYDQFTLPTKVLHKNITVEENQAREYWTANKFNYLTKPEIQVQYIIAEAPLEDALKNKKEQDVAKNEGETETVETKLSDSEKNELINATGDKMDSFFVKLQDQNGLEFKNLAESLEFEVITSPYFNEDTIPNDFKQNLYRSRETVYDFIKGLPATKDMESVSNVFSIGEGRYLLAQVIERKSAVPNDFDTVRSQVEVDYKQEKSLEIVESESLKVRQKLEKDLTTTTPKELAIKLGINYQKKEEIFYKNTQGDLAEQDVYYASIQTKLNTLSKPIDQTNSAEDRTIIIRPLERSYTQSEENQKKVEQEKDQIQGTLNDAIFQNWFNHQLATSDYKKIDLPTTNP